MRYRGGVLTASFSHLKTPDAPTLNSATIGNSQVTISFSAPSNIGNGAITSYQAVVTDSLTGQVFANISQSTTIVITGLTNGRTYTAKVAATNIFGTGPFSSNSNSFIPS